MADHISSFISKLPKTGVDPELLSAFLWYSVDRLSVPAVVEISLQESRFMTVLEDVVGWAAYRCCAVLIAV